MKMYWEMVLVVVLFTTTRVVEVAEGEDLCPMSCNGVIIDLPCISHGPEYQLYYEPAYEIYCRSNKQIFQIQYMETTPIIDDQQRLLFTFEGIIEIINYRERSLYFQEDTLSLVNVSFINWFYTSFPFQRPDHYPYPYQINDPSYSSSYDSNNITKYTFFNCSSSSFSSPTWDPDYIKYLSTPGFRIYARNSYHLTIDVPFITSCIKMFDITWGFSYPLDPSNQRHADPKERFYYNWSQSRDYPKPRPGLLPLISLVLIFSAPILWYSNRLEKKRKWKRSMIKIFMDDFKALKPTRYSYSDLKKITNKFKHKLGKGSYGSVFKGQISSDIDVAVKVLHSDSTADGDNFINEVGTIGRIHHVNVVRLLGYCADGCSRALVYEFQPNHSLEKFVYSGENQLNFIGWKKMQQIALGTAKGIEYLHQGCTQQILHLDIKPHNILLDTNFNPKISDFGLAKLCNKGQSKVTITMTRGTIGYIAPEVFSLNSGKVSAKTDVYSFGMLLLEMVGANNISNVDEVENKNEVNFPKWIHNRLEESRDIIIQIENDDDSKIAKKLTVVGLWCIGWHPVDRPSMKVVIQMLEGDDCPAMPPNPFRAATTSTAAAHSRSNICDRLQVISESEWNI